MHFSAAALLALSSLSITYAAPVANSQDGLERRQINYQVVNVDGESNSSAAPEVETVTETLKSTVTAPGSPAVDQTVTVTATPSYTPYSSVPLSSTPLSHLAPPPGDSFMPPHGNGFFRRGLNAAGNPVRFAQNYTPSPSSSWPTVPTPSSLAARDYEGWYPSSSWTPSVSVPVSSTPLPSLAARQYAGWTPSSSVPYPSSTPLAPSSPLVARQYQAPSSSIATPSSPVYTPTGTPSLAARQFGRWGSSSIATPSVTPSATPSAYVYPRAYGDAPFGTPSGTPSSGAIPSGLPTSIPLKRSFSPASSSPASSSTPIPAIGSWGIPRSNALLY